MTPKINQVGKRYGKLVVVKEFGRNKYKQITWLCKCDCGGEKVVTSSGLNTTESCGCLRKEKAQKKFSSKLVGKKFNSLTVIKDSGERLGNSILWLCLCECGTYKKLKGYPIQKGIVKSCGCFQSPDLTGRKFGRLTVKGYSGESQKGITRNKIWDCKCECGKEIKVPTGRLQSKKTRSCGCLFIEVQSGKNNNKYNPLLTEEDRLNNNRYTLTGGKVSHWRNQVYKRDDYTCQICEARNGNGKKVVLNAHHLNGWHWFEEGRFDVTNGVTLCGKCHSDFHRKYGYRENTKEQFEEYIQALA